MPAALSHESAEETWSDQLEVSVGGNLDDIGAEPSILGSHRPRETVELQVEFILSNDNGDVVPYIEPSTVFLKSIQESLHLLRIRLICFIASKV